MTSPHLAQGNPSDQSNNPEDDNSAGVTELFGPPQLGPPLFGPPPSADEAFPPAMRAVPPPPPPPPPPTTPTPTPSPSPSVQWLVQPAAEPAPPRRRRGVGLVVGAVAVALVGTGGVAAYASAHKTVTLDVDGKVTVVETFQGDVADLLADEGVKVTTRDAVTPAVGGALREGGTVVVRYGHKVTLRVDGERQTAWVTALDADEALATLSGQDGDVVLLPSRTDGRVTLPLRLDVDDPVILVVRGEPQRVADGAVALDDLLAEHEVKVDADDRVTIERGEPAKPGAPTLSVVVKQVQNSIDETVSSIPFETVTATDPDHYKDLAPYLATEGVEGKRVTSWDITTVDGKVVRKEKLSTWVDRAPVDKVIMYGSKARPEPKPDPKPKKDSGSDSKKDRKSDDEPDPKPESTPDSKKSDEQPKSKEEPTEKPRSESEPEARTVSTAGAWAELAKCESGGDPTTNTGNGYYGLYQFSQPTWEAMGGSGLPSEASAAEQTMRAQALQRQSGWGQWPGCASALGLY